MDLSDGMFEVTLVKVPQPGRTQSDACCLAQRDIDTAQMYCFKTSWLKVETEKRSRGRWTANSGQAHEIVIENQKQALHIMVPGEENEAQ
ncbi:MAG: hypothetical protein ACLURV_13570 [Gallintestinimicrobium sp.]